MRNRDAITPAQRTALLTIDAWEAGDPPVVLHHLTRYGLGQRGFLAPDAPLRLSEAGREALAKGGS